MIHTGNIRDKMQEAKDTLFMAETYMDSLGEAFERLRRQKVTESQLKEYVGQLLPMEKDATPVQEKNTMKMREGDCPKVDLLTRESFKLGLLTIFLGPSQSLCKPPDWCKIKLHSLEVLLWQEEKKVHRKQPCGK